MSTGAIGIIGTEERIKMNPMPPVSLTGLEQLISASL
jgi:hypothetical protein